MFEPLLEAVRRACDGERTIADVRSIARFHRIQSSPGYDEAADWMEDAIRRTGLVPERVSVAADGRTRHLGFPMPEGWRCRHATATLHDRERRAAGSRSWRSRAWTRSSAPTCAARWC